MAYDNKNVLKPGTLLKSHDRTYTVLKVLGQGGFGITYLVETYITVGNINAKVRFAIKEHFVSSMCARAGDTLNVEFSQPVAETVGKLKNAFVKEARRVQNLGINNINIVNINEVFEQNNTAYYVMEYLEGESLEDFVAARGALSTAATVDILRPVIAAVAELHRNNLTHYDIKPQNIIITTDSNGNIRPVLIDFGLAKHYGTDGKATSTLGTSGYSVGYAPIEQYAGLTDFTPQADVYALGATMYYCLTGRTPDDALKLKNDILRSTLDKFGCPPRLAETLSKAMQMLPENRPADAGALLASLTLQNNLTLPIKNSYCVIPGSVYAGEYAGDLYNPEKKIADLLNFGITHFIDLTEENELNPYRHLLPPHVYYHRFAVRDRSVPRSIVDVFKLVRYIAELARFRDNKIYIHCWGGVGRTGTIVACLYQYLGETATFALNHLRQSFAQCPKSKFRQTPEIPLQIDFIFKFGEYLNLCCVKNGRRYTPENIVSLEPGEVFVFGSNLGGQHHGGAARAAFERFGAVWGQGVGMAGQSYAIPTMHGPVDSIRPYVNDFLAFARSRPDLTFYVTRIGCGIAGFRDEEIAPLFREAYNLPNVVLPESFCR